jgi:hypothetical protein
MLLLEDRRFYIYIYLDPRKEGSYIYGTYVFNFEPFYVGKGNGNRAWSHISKKELNKNKNTYKNNKINNILSEGYYLKPIILKNFLTEKEAFYLEKELIKLIGRYGKNGPLTNITDGGEGVVGFSNKGFKMPELAKQKLRELHLGEKNPMWGKKCTEEERKKQSERMKGQKKTKQTKENMSKAKKGSNNPMYGITKNEEFKNKLSEFMKGNIYNKGKLRSEKIKEKIRKERGVKIICLETKQIYNFLIDISEKFNVSITYLRKVLTHEKNSLKGFHFIYLEEYDKNKNYDLSFKITNSKKVINIETGIIYNSLIEAGKSINKDRPDLISKNCRGLIESAYGYHWKFI